MGDGWLDARVGAKFFMDYLGEMGFLPRDADGNDLQHGDDQSLRFKIGTSYHEVAIQIVYADTNPTRVMRVTHDHQIPEAAETLRTVIERHWQHLPVTFEDDLLGNVRVVG